MRRTAIEYDALGREICILNAAGERDTLRVRCGRRFSRPAILRRPGGTLRLRPQGRLTRIEHADGTLTRLGYGMSGRLAVVTAADGQETTFEYDEKGACTKAERAGVAVAYEYDAEGRCVLEDQGGSFCDGPTTRVTIASGWRSMAWGFGRAPMTAVAGSSRWWTSTGLGSSCATTFATAALPGKAPVGPDWSSATGPTDPRLRAAA